MRTNLTAGIAWRYLLAKKSHGAVGTISTVSVCALAVATAAIICVLSVFNGFRSLIGERLDTLTPDVIVTPAQGKVFDDGEQLAARIARLPGVQWATPTISDNALLICHQQEMPVKVKGVIPEEYRRVTSVRSLLLNDTARFIDGAPEVTPGGKVWQSVPAIGTAMRLRAYQGDGALIFAPKRQGRVNLANPAASFISDSIAVSNVYRSDQAQFDEDGIIIPIDLARSLFQYDRQASAIEVRLSPGIDAAQGASVIDANLNGDHQGKFVVRDRMRQQEMDFRMVAIEKWVSFLFLVFILIIAGFNIISALSMLVLEKEEAIGTLSSLGLSRNRIGAVFAWESIYVSAAGGIAGIMLGLALCLLQQHFGLITIGGDPEAAIVTAYPVVVEPLDILITLAPVTVLGLITAAITASFARSRIVINRG